MPDATVTIKKMIIDGKACDADNGRLMEIINPATEEIIAAVSYGGPAETRRRWKLPIGPCRRG
jgi:hypothetical protein